MTNQKQSEIELRVILQKYADVDPDELGEDKFIGCHDLNEATKSLLTLIDTACVEARIDTASKIRNGLPTENFGKQLSFIDDEIFELEQNAKTNQEKSIDNE